MDNLNLTKYFHRSLFRIPESVNKCMDTIQTNVYNFPKISAFRILQIPIYQSFIKQNSRPNIVKGCTKGTLKYTFHVNMMIIHLSKINLLNPPPWSVI